MRKRTNRFIAMVLLSLTVLSLSNIGSANAVSPSNFSNTNSAINAAFQATYNAQKNGGNVTALIQELNVAVNLVANATVENSTNPSLSLSDLQNATQVANLVLSQSTSISRSGTSAVEARNSESIGTAVAIVIIASLIYFYAERIYRRAWYYSYRDHVVKARDG